LVISERTFTRSEASWRRTMAKRKKIPKLTPEELARRARTTRMLDERIAYHEAKAREEEERRAGKPS
jgi:hypothetical protein